MTAKINLDAYIEKQMYFVGTSGSVLEDMKRELAKLQSGILDTNISVAAVCGLDGASMESVPLKTAPSRAKLSYIPSAKDSCSLSFPKWPINCPTSPPASTTASGPPRPNKNSSNDTPPLPQMDNALSVLIKISNETGKDPAFTQAAGGNTSVKTGDGKYMFIKASGTALKNMNALSAGENSASTNFTASSMINSSPNSPPPDVSPKSSPVYLHTAVTASQALPAPPSKPICTLFSINASSTCTL